MICFKWSFLFLKNKNESSLLLLPLYMHIHSCTASQSSKLHKHADRNLFYVCIERVYVCVWVCVHRKQEKQQRISNCNRLCVALESRHKLEAAPTKTRSLSDQLKGATYRSMRVAGVYYYSSLIINHKNNTSYPVPLSMTAAGIRLRYDIFSYIIKKYSSIFLLYVLIAKRA